MGRGASRGHLLAALDASLERLRRRPRRPLAAARVGRRDAARGDARRLRRRRLLRPHPLRRRQQLQRLADRAGRHLAAGVARPQPGGEHAGRVLAAAAGRRAGGRAGRRGARAGRAGLVPARPGPAHRQVPALHAVGVARGRSARWQGFIDGLRSHTSDRIVEAVITAAEGLGTTPARRRAGLGPRPAGRGGAHRGRAHRPAAAGLARRRGRAAARGDPHGAGGRLRPALRLPRAPRPTGEQPRSAPRSATRSSPPSARRASGPGWASGGRRAARGRHHSADDVTADRLLKLPRVGKQRAERLFSSLPVRAADLRGGRPAGRRPASRPGWPRASPTRSAPTPPAGCATTRGRCSACTA